MQIRIDPSITRSHVRIAVLDPPVIVHAPNLVRSLLLSASVHRERNGALKHCVVPPDHIPLVLRNVPLVVTTSVSSFLSEIRKPPELPLQEANSFLGRRDEEPDLDSTVGSVVQFELHPRKVKQEQLGHVPVDHAVHNTKVGKHFRRAEPVIHAVADVASVVRIQKLLSRLNGLRGVNLVSRLVYAIAAVWVVPMGDVVALAVVVEHVVKRD
mmetsp:Transcript_15820/g.36458  ORF Transcript_15820/g.36458 Transcript_15820/m.36458 type:complete len:212 (-) Transcript_15820:861-1496(-)